MFELGEIIDLAIQIERNGERTYAEAAGKAKRPDLVDALTKLASDEREHVEWFEALKKECAEEGRDESMRDFGRRLLGDILGEQRFSLAEVDFERIETVKEVLAAALEFEKDTILFYQMIQAAIADATVSGGLDKIIHEEKQHVSLIETFISDPLKPLDRP